MVGVLILTHGNLARELLASARKIAGDLESFEALALSWTDGIEKAQEKVAEALARLDAAEAGILILTDIFGGTPSNIAMAFRDPGRVEVVSGVNLPMVVRLGCLRNDGMPVEEIATWIREKGQSSIYCSSELPRPAPTRSSETAATSDDQAVSPRIDPCEDP